MMGVSGERCLITSRSQTLAYMANEPYTDTEANGRTWSIDRRFSEKDVLEFLSAWATQQSANQIGPWHLILKKQFRNIYLPSCCFLRCRCTGHKKKKWIAIEWKMYLYSSILLLLILIILIIIQKLPLVWCVAMPLKPHDRSEKQYWLEINVCEFVVFTITCILICVLCKSKYFNFFPRTDQADLVIIHHDGVYMHSNGA